MRAARYACLCDEFFTSVTGKFIDMSLVRASILGGVDGVITSFAIVSGSHAGSLGFHTVVVVGTSSLLADGFSMGVSEYLSSSSVVTLGSSPLILGFACFLTFVVCGSIPLIVFLFTTGNILSTSMFALVELMILGASRTHFTSEPLLRGFFQTSILGSAAGGVAYAVGYATASLA